METISALGIDLAKNVFQLHGVDAKGRVVLQRRVGRQKLKEFVAQLPQCVIGMEACGGANYWGRLFEGMGHTVKLMPPQYVRPYVKSNKNDQADAEAIAEAVSRPSMRFVSIKHTWQQDIQSVHRVREQLVRRRTATMNEIRGLLQEYGEVIPKGKAALTHRIPELLEADGSEVTPILRGLLQDLVEEVNRLHNQVVKYEKQIKTFAANSEECRRLQAVEGVGPITATAVVAAVGSQNTFKNGREFAAWLGLVPKQWSTGGRTVLLGISKRGDGYLRKLLIHGARAALKNKRFKAPRRQKWIEEKLQTKGMNKTAVALANRNARVLWAMLANKTEYRTAA